MGEIPRLPDELEAAQEAETGTARLTQLRDGLLADTQLERDARMLQNFRELLRARPQIEYGEHQYQLMRTWIEEGRGKESPPVAALAIKPGMSVGGNIVQSPREYIEDLSQRIASESSPLGEEKFKENYVKNRLPYEYHPQRYQEHLQRKHEIGIGGIAQLFGYGNAALEVGDPKTAVFAYEAAGVLDHGNVTRKIEEYAKRETDPRRRIELAEALREVLGPPQEAEAPQTER